jgi:P pilus assembly chaperone PapD
VSLPAAARTSSGVTVGTVTRIDGDTIYVKEGSGATVAVKLLPATTISKSQGVSSRAVRPGDSVTVKGTAGSGGAVKSTSISDSGDNSTATTTSTAAP